MNWEGRQFIIVMKTSVDCVDSVSVRLPLVFGRKYIHKTMNKTNKTKRINKHKICNHWHTAMHKTY